MSAMPEKSKEWQRDIHSLFILGSSSSDKLSSGDGSGRAKSRRGAALRSFYLLRYVRGILEMRIRQLK
jgi:hypothetical protein